MNSNGMNSNGMNNLFKIAVSAVALWVVGFAASGVGCGSGPSVVARWSRFQDRRSLHHGLARTFTRLETALWIENRFKI